MPRNLWWTTRPKRKLITIVDALRTFLAIAEGKPWKGNRNLHIDLEDALEKYELKGEGERRDGSGSGGRTYANWLYSFGLYFEDSNGLVRVTLAGEDLIKGFPPVSILTNQILNFQYPSPFSRKPNINVSSRFKIFPFRFILKLLLHPKLDGFLGQGEIARFVITEAETDKDLNSVADKIIAYRKSNKDDSVFDEKFERFYKKLDELETVANTFINQLEFTQFIGRLDGESKIYILDSKKSEIEKLLNQSKPLLTITDGKNENFQRSYGVGPNYQKDTRKFTAISSITSNQVEKSKVLLALSDILANQPIKSINSNVLNQIAEKTGVKQSNVEKIISSIGVQPSYDLFEEKYLQFSVGDKQFATEFEKATEGIFGKEGLGFITKWIGSKGINPDVLAISIEKGNQFLGVLDTKASNNYSIGSNNRRAMIHDYIPLYKNYTYEGTKTDLAFFSYIAGGFKSTIDNGINLISKEARVNGSAITANVLLKLLRKHRSSPFTKTDFKRIFSLNRQILPTDFET